VKEDEMGRACSTNGEKGNAYMILVEMPEGNIPLEIPRSIRKDIIKENLRGMG
jgi:hypothetical protein